MVKAFDPYRNWLGIPSGERPPNHYALLGLSRFEDDPEAIANAADRQMAYVRTHQTGPNAKLTQSLLNELAAARLCLLNAAQKARYDADLRAKQAASTPSPPVQIMPQVAPEPMAARLPLPVAVPLPASVMETTTLRSLSPRKPASKFAGWLAPAAGGFVAGALLVWLALSLGGGSRPPRPSEPGESVAATSGDKQTSNAADAAKTADRSGARTGSAQHSDKPQEADSRFAAKRSASSIFASLEKPGSLGVTASRLVIWNQHNAYHRDRGALECNVRLLADGRQVWSQEGMAVPWDPNEELSLTVALPAERFERVRVEITKWEQTGGGLAEIEILSPDGRNLAYGQPVVCSDVFPGGRFDAKHVVDGIVKPGNAEAGYWLLPDGVLGWVEVDLSLPRPTQLAGVTADKLAIWNQHNGPINNSATARCNVTAYSGQRSVWRQEQVELPWEPGEDLSAELKLPSTAFDRLRFEVTPPEGKFAGLAEVQILAGEQNLALDCPALASGVFDVHRRESRVADGIVSSSRENIGYWLLSEQTPGWVEIDLACLDAQHGAACRQLGLSLALADGDWQRGLAWLARGDDRALRRLAKADLERAYDAPDQLAVGDGWWDLSEQGDGQIRKRLLARAAWWYRRVLSKLQEFPRMQVQARLDEALPGLPERDFLFFMPESKTKLWDGLFREIPIVVRGQTSPYGLYMHPDSDGSARAAFSLGGQYHRFRGAAAIDDTARNLTATALTFRIVGDGRELWKSTPLKETGASETFDVEVKGINELELLVDCPGDNGHAHSVWVEPRLER